MNIQMLTAKKCFGALPIQFVQKRMQQELLNDKVTKKVQ
jgi:hypothetical protein